MCTLELDSGKKKKNLNFPFNAVQFVAVAQSVNCALLEMKRWLLQFWPMWSFIAICSIESFNLGLGGRYA